MDPSIRESFPSFVHACFQDLTFHACSCIAMPTYSALALTHSHRSPQYRRLIRGTTVTALCTTPLMTAKRRLDASTQMAERVSLSMPIGETVLLEVWTCTAGEDGSGVHSGASASCAVRVRGGTVIDQCIYTVDLLCKSKGTKGRTSIFGTRERERGSVSVSLFVLYLL